ncbi:serine/threonine-protein phosphatase 4 regulatory subunit 2-A isoform X1 [Carica papaya]|uniref:serine/threonine-protein phosphatase 4 regulatory subunit 2-A isoform X1 n=1 Tax=Carica papaya TaxID=3649 RepID=UPI000B8CC7F1|nr:serine/threonine-protein phosphatase 4 regulatory subunit 2-A isoform X1 [Carica papaya]XP_021900139.1 serine/threonine-protein phosphatase 4 regulatory subunit 2-A isoform X1 [Carica papaya]XP_021900140.1 serine/threonine-protein phosphatase 4 regulatory subunit 2-A isoform X1 [Carica papaya]XP_021900141.1 serine/threonine-protein phosphatase 4 regulatory subunit 2-A isoform X1 [Carica papaya]XP_021900143.1 serine/threonine-protein phosphatase 4 regulatory subunit 2-A isoform X1 [Carica pap
MALNETSQTLGISNDDASHTQDNMVPDILNNCCAEPEPVVDDEEVGRTLEVIASTGKFWHDWEKLKGMLSFKLKQVLSEYPEARMTADEQNASLGEMYTQLVKRLDEVLHSFDEGPPFTLQRLCEILLAAQSIYPNLSKLALALEKNLLVSSTLNVCVDPYPQTAMRNPDEPNTASEEPLLHSNLVPNGVEPMAADSNEMIMEVEGGDINDMALDMEAIDDIVRSSETNSVPPGS